MDIIMGDVYTSILKSFIEKTSSFSDGVSNNEKLSNIREWYLSERLVMVLGAGSSMAYGLPDWNTLLQRLLLTTLENNNNNTRDTENLAKTFSKVFMPNSLVAAKYLHNYFRKKHPSSTLAFENAIRDTLYEGIETTKVSELLQEIRQYCIAAGRNPNIDSIITYNYDDLLETCLSEIGIDIPFQPIHASGMKHEQQQLPIYHVHGYLPRKVKLTNKNRVVLSEDGYHQQYHDVYGWSNLTQINKFKDYNCVFIGLSFSDPNLRRILDISKKERGDDKVHHYCFKKKYSLDTVKDRLKKLMEDDQSLDLGQNEPNFNFEALSKDLTNFVEQFDEKDALSFGVGVIWVDSYDDIPSLLKKVRVGLK